MQCNYGPSALAHSMGLCLSASPFRGVLLGDFSGGNLCKSSHASPGKSSLHRQEHDENVTPINLCLRTHLAPWCPPTGFTHGTSALHQSVIAPLSALEQVVPAVQVAKGELTAQGPAADVAGNSPVLTASSRQTQCITERMDSLPVWRLPNV